MTNYLSKSELIKVMTGGFTCTDAGLGPLDEHKDGQTGRQRNIDKDR